MLVYPIRLLNSHGGRENANTRQSPTLTPSTTPFDAILKENN
jgi:hypothetical protein